MEALKDEEEEREEKREEERWARSQEASRASSSHWERWPLQGHLHHRPGHRFWKVGRGAGVEEEEGQMMRGRGLAGPARGGSVYTSSNVLCHDNTPLFLFFFSFKEGDVEKFRPET